MAADLAEVNQAAVSRQAGLIGAFNLGSTPHPHARHHVLRVVLLQQPLCWEEPPVLGVNFTFSFQLYPLAG